MLTYYRLISVPNLRRRRRWGKFRDHVNSILRTKAQERTEEVEKARRAAERERVRSQRRDLPCSATRQNSSSQSEPPLSQDAARETNQVRKKAIKEPRWNGGLTHNRSYLGPRMMELLAKLEEGARQAASHGKLLKKRGDG